MGFLNTIMAPIGRPQAPPPARNIRGPFGGLFDSVQRPPSIGGIGGINAVQQPILDRPAIPIAPVRKLIQRPQRDDFMSINRLDDPVARSLPMGDSVPFTSPGNEPVSQPAPTTSAAVATDVGAVPQTTMPVGAIDPVLLQQATAETLTDPLIRSLYFGTQDSPGFFQQLQQAGANLIGSDVPLQQTAGLTPLELLARQQGQIFNPNLELLFDAPTLRSFTFSFKMTPRSQQEARQCKLIIRSFKQNMAPKANLEGGQVGGTGIFLKTPNIFELSYKRGGRDHPFLHKFKQCFLTNFSVNYTAEGTHTTYDDSTPVSMTMDMTFKEIEPIYDTDYKDSDNSVGF